MTALGRYPTDPAACLELIAELARRGRTLTADQWEDLALGAGRIHGPELLYSAWRGHVIAVEAVAAVVGSVWAMSEYPDRSLARSEWRELFGVAGYTVDGKRAARPTELLTLWRGSVPERARDWSWTASRAVAERYATGRIAGRPLGHLYRATVHPIHLLCSNTGHDRDEAEYVVDTDLIEITEVTTHRKETTVETTDAAAVARRLSPRRAEALINAKNEEGVMALRPGVRTGTAVALIDRGLVLGLDRGARTTHHLTDLGRATRDALRFMA